MISKVRLARSLDRLSSKVALFLLFSLAAALVPGHGQVVINEIMYRPGTTFPENTALEFIELHNPTDAPVDISGWALTNGAGFTFPPGTTIAAGGFIVVASDPVAVQAAYGVTGVLGPWAAGARLSNGGEKITLSQPGAKPGSFDTVDSVTYASEGDWSMRVREPVFNGWEWSSAADNGGKSLELRNPAISNNNGQNWLPSTAPAGGTPGAVNTVVTSNVPPIIHDVKHSPAVPTSAQDVTISCDVTDEMAPDGLTATLFWRDATSTTPGAFQSRPMSSDGGGRFSTVLGPKADLTIVEFYVSVNDGALTRTWPAPTSEGQNANCQYVVSDEPRTPTDSYYWLVLTAAENAAFDNVNDGSNRQFNQTFISTRGSETTIRYRSSMRIRGNSSRNYQFRPLRISLPNEDKWNGVTDFPLNPKASFLQFFGMRLFQAAGLVADDAIPIELRRNGMESTTSNGSTPDYGKWVRAEQIGGDYVNNHYRTEANAGGDVFKKIDNGGGDNFYWASDFVPPTNPDEEVAGWTKQNNSAANDWTALTHFFNTWQTAAAPHFPGSPPGDVAESDRSRQSGIGNWDGTAFTAGELAAVSEVSDLQQWARHLAAMTIIQDLETKLSNGVDDDYSVYFPPPDGSGQRKMQLLPHDLDTILGLGDNSRPPDYTGLYNMTEEGQSGYGFRTLLPLIGTAAMQGSVSFLAMYHNAIRELYGTVFNADTTGGANPPFYQFVDSHLAGWVPPDTITAIKDFATARQTYLLGLLDAQPITPPPAVSRSSLLSVPGTLMIHEVLAHNVAIYNHEGTFPDAIELYNAGGTAIDLAGKSLTDDPTLKDKFVFPAGTSIPGGGMLVVHADSAATSGLHTGFGLDNEGEGVWLYDTVTNGQTLLDSVVFGPQPPDLSIGRTGATRNLWRLCTPKIGADNDAIPTLDPPGGLVINELSANNDYLLDTDFVELYNPSALPVAIGQMALTDDFINFPSASVLPELSFIGKHSYVRFFAKGGSADPRLPGELPFAINKDFGWIALIGLNGTIVDRQDVIAQTFNTSVGRSPDGAATLEVFGLPVNVPTPGTANVNAPASVLDLLNGLRISEILYAPLDLEYIELHNIGPTVLDLTGVRFTRGITYTFSTGTTLAPGAYLVVCRDRDAFQTQFTGAVPLADGAFTGMLSDTGETIAFQLPEPRDLNILSFSYSASWFAPLTDSGYSLSVIDDAMTPARDWGDRSTWTPSTNLYGTPGSGPPPTITSASLAAGIISEPFFYPITATQAPTSYNASGLPAGVTVNTVSGLISGTPTESGAFNVVVSATSPSGTGQLTVAVTIASSGPIATFVWSTIASPQASGVPVAVTLTAKDAQGRTVDGFNGALPISGQGAGTTAGIMLITECGTGSTDYFELENVGNAPADTDGWFILPNNANGQGGGPNAVHPVWLLPASVPAGAVTAISENSPQYSSGINWSSNPLQNPNGWCMLCDNTGAVRDFVAWGYDAATIASINVPSVTVNGTTYTDLRASPSNWTGAGADIGFFDTVRTRFGSTDQNTLADWVSGSDEGNKGVHNINLTVPFVPPPPVIPVTPGTAAFVNGVWNGNLTINQVASGMKVNVTNGSIVVGTNTFNVIASPPPVITSPGSVLAVIGAQFSYQITGTNGPTGFSATGLPGGVLLNASTGLLAGTPTAAGLVNATVFATNSGGTGSSIVTIDVQNDADGDGMGDAWEAAHGLNPGLDDASADRDGDGLTNRGEWIAGTLPDDPASRFAIIDERRVGSDIEITWTTFPGKRYRVHTRANFTASDWTEITSAPIVAAGSVATFLHPGGAGGGQRHYRVSTE